MIGSKFLIRGRVTPGTRQPRYCAGNRNERRRRRRLWARPGRDALCEVNGARARAGLQSARLPNSLPPSHALDAAPPYLSCRRVGRRARRAARACDCARLVPVGRGARHRRRLDRDHRADRGARRRDRGVLAGPILPEKIAEKRHHPQKAAINTLCLLSLFFGGLLWPMAWLWAYTRPIGYRMAYGTDKHEDYTSRWARRPRTGSCSPQRSRTCAQNSTPWRPAAQLPPELRQLREDLGASQARRGRRCAPRRTGPR